MRSAVGSNGILMGTVLMALAVTIPLSACGGGDGSGGYDTPQAVAAAAGCRRVKPQSPELFADDAVSCQFNGHYTSVQWFESGDHLASWVEVAGSFGGSILRGQNW